MYLKYGNWYLNFLNLRILLLEDCVLSFLVNVFFTLHPVPWLEQSWTSLLSSCCSRWWQCCGRCGSWGTGRGRGCCRWWWTCSSRTELAGRTSAGAGTCENPSGMDPNNLEGNQLNSILLDTWIHWLDHIIPWKSKNGNFSTPFFDTKYTVLNTW